MKFEDLGFKATTNGRFKKDVYLRFSHEDATCGLSFDYFEEDVISHWFDREGLDDMIAILQEARRRLGG